MATRFYFPATTVADVNPAPGAWNYITEAVFRYLAKTKGASPITLGTQVGPWTATAGQKALDRVYVSDPLSPQTISGTAKMQLMVREYATSDNVDQLILLIKVVSGNGATVRGTLLALGNYASTAEFINNATHRNKKGADGDALSSVVCLEHDRIVVEIGYCNSVAGTTPEASAKWGENATDLPENETQTTDGAGWIEFSGNIVFSSEPNLDKQVAATGDDGRYYTEPDEFDTSETYFSLGYYDGFFGHMHGFARWTGVSYEGTVDANSYIQCYAKAIGVLTPELKVYVVDESDPLAPTTAAEFNADPLTTAAVDWDGAWPTLAWAQSPSLVPPLQEYVNTFGPIVNKALMMQIKNDHAGTGTEYNITRAWDYAGNLHGPKLHIEYTPAGGPTEATARLAALADLEAIKSARFAAQANLEASSKARFAGQASPEAVKSARIALMADLEKIISARLAGMADLELSFIETATRFAARASLEAVISARFAGLASPEKEITSRLAHRSDLEKITSDRIANRGDLEAVKSVRLAGLSDLEKITIARIAGQGNLEALGSGRLAGEGTLEATQSTRIASRGDLEAEKSARMAAEAQLEKIISARIAGRAEFEGGVYPILDLTPQNWP
jgi:hypothetical protein